MNHKGTDFNYSCQTSLLVLRDPLFEHGCGTSGPGTYPAPGAGPAHSGTSTHLGRLPIGLQVLFCHAAVPGTYHQHPGTGTTRERERDGNVSMMSISVSDAPKCRDIGGLASLIYSVWVRIIILGWR